MPRLSTLPSRLGSLPPRITPPPKQADAELLTAGHKTWRKAVLDRAGWRCQAPGCTVQGGRGGAMLYADHIVERQDGGAALDVRNGEALCARHHTEKTIAERAKRMAR
jgi:5-methylcytosine-specific restriction enzyme A